MRSRWLLVLFALLLGKAQVLGAYGLSLSSQGAPEIAVKPGEAFDLDVALSSDRTDTHDAATFRLVFSTPGLLLQSVQWSAPYATGGPDDASLPPARALPIAIHDDTVSGRGLPERQADIYLSNAVLPPAAFTTGGLLRLNVKVPDAYRGPEDVVVRAEPESFSAGFATVVVGTPAPFRLKVLAAPASTLPLLSVQRVGEQVLLAWPDIAREVVLEQSPNLNQGGDWQPVLLLPEWVDGYFNLLIAPESPASVGFYRLRAK